MVLPGVPRDRRITFVAEMLELLLDDGIQGITVSEHDELSKLITRLLDGVEPVPEEPEVKPSEEPVSC
ncbi:MAG TPA: hypothetical protein P5207_09740 [Candidatus Sabulitectum sp.]|nr:hypothetical protein [Candidatus Sabulitectum sp.]HPR21788.1 hypothetical protein [Candidatus Sabulitectum sp.]HRW78936.1 hypothetical protein [Candidatus Sabulitectum sp.]